MALLEIKLRPAGPWRVGHSAGDRERVDTIFHSDGLFSAITHAMHALGWLEEWLEATARASAGPAVRFSSLFPFIGETRLISPPRTSWPPSGAGKLYVKAAKLVPLQVARKGVAQESRWYVDGASECLLPVGAPPPFQFDARAAATVDRLTGHAESHRNACLEFAAGAGWWCLADIAEEKWEPRVKSAFRLLADTGFGGGRSKGWGRTAEPEFASPASFLESGGSAGNAWWLLSLYSPHDDDAVDWSRGEYSAITRGGWTDSPAGMFRKRHVRMIEEGSVLIAPSVRGKAVDVAPAGFAHPAWRAGFAFAVPVPSEAEA